MKIVASCLIFTMVIGVSWGAELFDFLPDPKELPQGLKAAGQWRLFDEKALYQHIDGGAELFLRNGFQRLCVMDYIRERDQNKSEVRIEIYDMGSVRGGADIFSANTLGIQKSAKFGEICTIDEMQIIFKRGRYYITVTSYEKSKEDQSTMAFLAGAVDKNICNSGK